MCPCVSDVLLLLLRYACLPILQCDWLFLESSHASRQMAQGWHCHCAQEAIWQQTWSMSLELICILSFKRPLMQSWLNLMKFSACLAKMTLCKHLKTHLQGWRWLDPNTPGLLYHFRVAVFLSRVPWGQRSSAKAALAIRDEVLAGDACYSMDWIILLHIPSMKGHFLKLVVHKLNLVHLPMIDTRLLKVWYPYHGPQLYLFVLIEVKKSVLSL